MVPVSKKRQASRAARQRSVSVADANPILSARRPEEVRALSWLKAEQLLATWEKTCRSTFDDMQRCAFCGICNLGGKNGNWTTVDPHEEDGQVLNAAPYLAIHHGHHLDSADGAVEEDVSAVERPKRGCF